MAKNSLTMFLGCVSGKTEGKLRGVKEKAGSVE